MTFFLFFALKYAKRAQTSINSILISEWGNIEKKKNKSKNSFCLPKESTLVKKSGTGR